MLFCLGWTFNFLIGGLSGVFLSDTPSDTDTHGSFFVMAHFHYTIMGGLIFTFFAAIYYWVPKMFGLTLNERLAKMHFWLLFIAFNSTFMPLFVLGMKGMPRRVVHLRPEPAGAQRVGVDLRVRARPLDARLPRSTSIYSLIFVREPRGGEPVALEVARVAGAHAGAGQQLRDDPRDRLRPLRLRHAAAAASAARRRGAGGRLRWRAPTQRAAEPAAIAARCPPRRRDPARAAGGRRSLAVRRRHGCWRAPRRSSSWRSCSPTSTCARSTRTTCGGPRTSNPTRRSAGDRRLCIVVSALLGDRRRGASCRQRLRAALAGRRVGWRLLLGLAAVALQCIAVHRPALRPHRRRLRERVLRLDSALCDRGARDDVLARDAGRHRAARTRAPAGRQHGRHRRGRPADRPGARRGRVLLGPTWRRSVWSPR